MNVNNSLIKTCTVLIAFLFPFAVKAVPIPGLYNTGVDDGGTVIPIGTVDTHYSVSGLASSAYSITPNPAWLAAPSGSNWIGPTDGNTTDPVGDYIYTLTFDLTGYDASTASISGDWAYDNLGVLSLNGNATSFTNPTQFFSLSSFTLNSGFVSGINTLEFKITNNPGTGANPTSLLVANLSGVVSPAGSSGSIPEPPILALFAIGLIGFSFAKSKRIS